MDRRAFIIMMGGSILAAPLRWRCPYVSLR